MRSEVLAEKYSRALFESIKEADQRKKMLAFLVQFKEAIHSSNELMAFANSPVIKPGDKKTAILKAAGVFKLDELSANFLVLLAENDRLYLIDEISERFQSIMDEEAGVTRGVARSAEELHEDEKMEITSVISQLTDKKVILDFKTDPGLIGSLVAHVGSLTIDDSLKTHLHRLEDDLKRRVH